MKSQMGTKFITVLFVQSSNERELIESNVFGQIIFNAGKANVSDKILKVGTRHVYFILTIKLFVETNFFDLLWN